MHLHFLSFHLNFFLSIASSYNYCLRQSTLNLKTGVFPVIISVATGQSFSTENINVFHRHTLMHHHRYQRGVSPQTKECFSQLKFPQTLQWSDSRPESDHCRVCWLDQRTFPGASLSFVELHTDTHSHWRDFPQFQHEFWKKMETSARHISIVSFSRLSSFSPRPPLFIWGTSSAGSWKCQSETSQRSELLMIS